jgi:hypothetical protein
MEEMRLGGCYTRDVFYSERRENSLKFRLCQYFGAVSVGDPVGSHPEIVVLRRRARAM